MVDVPFVLDINHRSQVWDIATAPGQTITISWTGVLKDHPCGSYGYAVQAGCVGASSNSGEVRFGYPGSGGQISFAATGFGSAINFDAFTDGYCSTGQLFGLDVQLSGTGVPYCSHGTRTKFGLEAAVYITPELLGPILLGLGAEFLLPFLAPFYFTAVGIVGLCSSGPPPMPVIDESSIGASIDTWRQVLYAVLWTQYCECVPGTPTPIPYPQPSPEKPPNWPTEPTFGCSNADLCAAVVGIQRQLAALSATVAASYGLTTLLQRNRLPYAFIRGESHSALTGAGSFDLVDALGVEIQLIDDAPDLEIEGTPPYKWNQGWVSVSDGGAMLQELRVTRSLQQWFPQHCQLATTFGYFLRDGVSATFTVLRAEP
jgi:hypothetical protein